MPVGILLDPPYLTRRAVETEVYGSDMDGLLSSAFRADAWKWYAERLVATDTAWRLLRDDPSDVEVPEGWDSVTETFSGIRDAERRKRRDMVLVQPGVPAGRRFEALVSLRRTGHADALPDDLRHGGARGRAGSAWRAPVARWRRSSIRAACCSSRASRFPRRLNRRRRGGSGDALREVRAPLEERHLLHLREPRTVEARHP